MISVSSLFMVVVKEKSIVNWSPQAVLTSVSPSFILNFFMIRLRVICLTLVKPGRHSAKCTTLPFVSDYSSYMLHLHNFIVLWILSLWIYYQGTCQCYCIWGTVSSFYFGVLSWLQKFTLGWILACVIG